MMTETRTPSHTTSERAAALLHGTLVGRYPLIWVVSEEEHRASGLLARVAGQLLPGHRHWRWSVATGLVEGLTPPPGQPPARSADEATRELEHVLDLIGEDTRPGIYLLLDPDPHLRREGVVRRLRELYHSLADQGRHVVLLSPSLSLPLELRKQVAVVDLPLPDLRELAEPLDQALKEARDRGSWDGGIDPELRMGLLRAIQGLTINEAHHVLSKVFSDHSIDEHVLAPLHAEKATLTRKEGVLQFVHREVGIEDVGGLDNLKGWLAKRRRLFRRELEGSGDLMPRGLLMMGISGCGKSLSVKAISGHWDLPLFRLDINQVFSGAHGVPEDAFARGLRLAEALAPCILWIDEIEGGITGYEGGNTGSAWRIFSTFLTWMQEKHAPVFVAATANRIDLLPAEIIRKGRFDQIFFIDLPSEEERAQIFKVHLSRRGNDLEQFDLSVLAKGTKGWNGAEIEQCVISAMIEATDAERPMTRDDLYAQMSEIVPLSTTMSEQIKAIRSWAHDRAMKAGR